MGIASISCKLRCLFVMERDLSNDSSGYSICDRDINAVTKFLSCFIKNISKIKGRFCKRYFALFLWAKRGNIVINFIVWALRSVHGNRASQSFL
jgi:hypothetical protein